MNFRARLVVAFLVVALIPLGGLAWFVRGEMTRRLTAEYARRVDARIGLIDHDLKQERVAVGDALRQVRNAVAADNRFRRSTADPSQDDRSYLLDYAGGAMRLAGLSMLQIQDEQGRIVSSGHFRNDYDRREPALPRLLRAVPGGTALVRVRTADAPMLVLAGVDSVDVGGRRFTIVGGVEAEAHIVSRLPGGQPLDVALLLPEDSVVAGDLAPAGAIVRELSVPFVDLNRGVAGSATIRVTHRVDELRALRRSVDRWFVAAFALAAVLAVLLAGWLASRASRPLVALAERAARVDLDRLDVDFDTGRRDEIGVLARGLDAMTDRLRHGASALKDAERRATLGELARQVNHDIRNGLTPIRNVFRHLTDLSTDDPARLPDVFAERRGTIESGIAYLDTLASNYARLSRHGERPPTDLSEVAARVVADHRGAGRARFETSFQPEARVLADALSLRRIIENLVDNAVESLGGEDGRVTVATTTAVGEGGDRRVRLSVSDTGCGIPEADRARIFDDFFTTRPDGSGLGLSIVRRLTMDLDGSDHR